LIEYVSLAIGTASGAVAFLAITLRMNHRKKLHDEWTRQMEAQRKLPFSDVPALRERPQGELIARQ